MPFAKGDDNDGVFIEINATSMLLLRNSIEVYIIIIERSKQTTILVAC